MDFGGTYRRLPILEAIKEYAGVDVKGMDEDELRATCKMMNPDGSCMMVVFTDAPLDARNLERLAKRAMLGLAKTGGIASNGSGDYVIAVSVNSENLIDESTARYYPTLLHNDDMSPLFEATIEATAEALWNSLFMATDMKGRNGLVVPALPIDAVLQVMRQPIL